MNQRERIFTAIREALSDLPERAAYPDWDASLPVMQSTQGGDAWERFCQRMSTAKGIPLTGTEALREWLAKEGGTLGYCDPFLYDTVFGSSEPPYPFETEWRMERVNDYHVGITRAAGAIAETGSVILKDQTTVRRLAALAPWVHVALLKREDIVETVGDAIDAFGDDPSVIFCTGPSKTADIEGILIQGVHGPGVQICCLED